MRLLESNQSLKKPLVWLEINKEALLQNVFAMKRLVGDRKIMAVLKANAYGLGAVGVAQTIQSEIDSFGVVGVPEALSLRVANITKPIINLGVYCNEDAKTLIDNSITPSIFRLNDLQQFARCAREQNKNMGVWVNVESGLGRFGVPIQDAFSFLQMVAQEEGITLIGVYTTLAEDPRFDAEQCNLFVALKKQWEQMGMSPLQWSIASSQGVFLLEQSMLSTVRLGISLFGYSPSAEAREQTRIFLTPSATYKTKVACVKELEPGESIFYRRVFVAQKKTRIAVLLPGYSYGLSSQLVNGGAVLIGGKRYPLVGGISATNCFVDIGLESDVDVNDEVVFFGTQGKNRIEFEEVCRITKQSAYECFSRIPEKVVRILV